MLGTWRDPPRRTSGLGRPARVALVGALAAVPLLAGAAADSVEVRPTVLAEHRTAGSAIWTGSHAYYFGGMVVDDAPNFVGALDDILRYDPASETLTRTGARLPAALTDTRAVWTGRHALVFGGWNGNHPADRIVRFDPPSNAVTVMGTRLPSDWAVLEAAWTGQHVFLFGAKEDCSDSSCPHILRYDPAADTLVWMNARLSDPNLAHAGAWSGRYVYFAGGWLDDGTRSDRIHRYDPRDDTLTTLETRLPTPFYARDAVWDNRSLPAWGCPSGCLYAFGYAGNEPDFSVPLLLRVVRFDPVFGIASFMPIQLDDATPIVWDGSGALLFPPKPGLVFETGIHRWSLAPGPPSALVARTGPGAGQITLEWGEPAHGDNVTAFRVYRGRDPGAETLVGSVGASRQWTDTLLPAGTAFQYEVSAVNAAGDEGPHSGRVAAKTFDVPGPPVFDAVEVDESSGTVQVRWLAPRSDGGTPVLRYRVYLDDGTGHVRLVSEQSLLTHTQEDALGRQPRSLLVGAVNAAGEGPRNPVTLPARHGLPGPDTTVAGLALFGLGSWLGRRRP